jgi:hypothetical protein
MQTNSSVEVDGAEAGRDPPRKRWVAPVLILGSRLSSAKSKSSDTFPEGHASGTTAIS